MVRDKYGRKMSKSLGNVIDPLEVINGCTLEDLLMKIDEGNLPAKEVSHFLIEHSYLHLHSCLHLCLHLHLPRDVVWCTVMRCGMVIFVR